LPILTFSSTIQKIATLAPTVRHLQISVPDNFSYTTGQFVSIIQPLPDGTSIRRPYSIAGTPLVKGSIDLCIKKVENGHVSIYLHEVKEGDTLRVMGPFGAFGIKDRSVPICLIGTGTGIAPMRSILLTLLGEGYQQPIILLTGTRFDDEELYADECKELMSRYPNFKRYHIVSRPSSPNYQGEVGRVQQLIEKYVSREWSGHFYLCGLWPMIEETVKMLNDRGVGKERIFYERYN